MYWLPYIAGSRVDASASRLQSGDAMNQRWNLMMSRRGFAHASLTGLASVAIMRPSLGRPSGFDDPALTLGVIASRDESGRLRDVARGIALGMDEARHAATLFDKKLHEVTAASPTTVGGEAIPQAVIFAGSSSEAPTAAREAANRKMVFVNASVSDDSLRRELCSAFVFHVAASDAMYASAQSAASPASAPVSMWNGALERYGAAQLNDRFRAASLPPNADTWSGWMAVKIVWESFLRAATPTGEGIATYLASENSQFDGHKGAPLSFRRWDHQLRQPLYSGAREIPDLSRSSAPVRQLLDTIGDREGATKCKS